MSKTRDAQVIIGTDTVTVQRVGSLNVRQARLLGDETTGTVRRLYLDRLVHLPREEEIGGWACSGAVSTVLTKDLTAPAAPA